MVPISMPNVSARDKLCVPLRHVRAIKLPRRITPAMIVDDWSRKWLQYYYTTNSVIALYLINKNIIYTINTYFIFILVITACGY